MKSPSHIIEVLEGKDVAQEVLERAIGICRNARIPAHSETVDGRIAATLEVLQNEVALTLIHFKGNQK